MIEYWNAVQTITPLQSTMETSGEFIYIYAHILYISIYAAILYVLKGQLITM